MKDQIEEKHALSESIYMSGHGLDWKDSDDIAEQLYTEGYRKQSEGEWKVDGNDYNRRAQCSNCEKEYAVQRGMLQLHRFPYCPNCGAKMKGGAE